MDIISFLILVGVGYLTCVFIIYQAFTAKPAIGGSGSMVRVLMCLPGLIALFYLQSFSWGLSDISIKKITETVTVNGTDTVTTHVHTTAVALPDIAVFHFVMSVLVLIWILLHIVDALIWAPRSRQASK